MKELLEALHARQRTHSDVVIGLVTGVCVREGERQIGVDVDKLKPLHAMRSQNTRFSCLGP